VLWFAIKVTLWLELLATVALGATSKVIVLALRANPTSIWKLKIVVGLLFILFFLLVLGPLSRAKVVVIFWRLVLLKLRFFGLRLRITLLLHIFLLRHEECSVEQKFVQLLREILNLVCNKAIRGTAERKGLSISQVASSALQLGQALLKARFKIAYLVEVFHFFLLLFLTLRTTRSPGVN
jgi:hypothetical protein